MEGPYDSMFLKTEKNLTSIKKVYIRINHAFDSKFFAMAAYVIALHQYAKFYYMN
jgi:hypothetical protein